MFTVALLAVFLGDVGVVARASGGELASLNCCGPFALQVSALALGLDVSTERILALVPVVEDGCSLDDLDRAARELGLRTMPLRWQGELPRSLRAPAVIPIVTRRGTRHFVAMLARDGDRVLIVDAPQRPAWITIESLRSTLNWDGNALHVAVDDAAILELSSYCDSRPSWIWLGLAPAALVLFAALRKFRRLCGRLTAERR